MISSNSARPNAHLSTQNLANKMELHRKMCVQHGPNSIHNSTLIIRITLLSTILIPLKYRNEILCKRNWWAKKMARIRKKWDDDLNEWQRYGAATNMKINDVFMGLCAFIRICMHFDDYERTMCYSTWYYCIIIEWRQFCARNIVPLSTLSEVIPIILLNGLKITQFAFRSCTNQRIF